MKFEYYVLNYNWNNKRVEMYNVFNNIYVREWTEKAIKKYLRSPKKYEHRDYRDDTKTLYGFPALCEEIRRIIMNQEWSRREYEISVSDAFVTEISDVIREIDMNENPAAMVSMSEVKEFLKKEDFHNPKLEKWDCYKQCEPNIAMITRECIWQYKQQLKECK